MSFDPENELEDALVRASLDPVHVPDFYREFAAGMVLVIQQEVASDTGDAVGVAMMEVDGRQVIPIFSSVARLQTFVDQASVDREVSYVGINSKELLRTVQGADLILNPGSEFGKEIPADEAARIADGSILEAKGREMQADMQCIIGEPANYPTNLVSVLARFFGSKAEVRRAWVAQIIFMDEEMAVRTLVGIESDGAVESVVAEAQTVIQHVDIPNPPLEFTEVDGRPGLAAYFLDQKPFYSRD